MSGVDRLDQMISYYPFTRKTVKWHKKVFFYLVEIAIHNAYVAHKLLSRDPEKTLLDFQMKIVKKLCRANDVVDQSSSSEDDDYTPPPAKAPKHDPRERLLGGYTKHHMETYPATENKDYPQRACRVCQKRGIRRDTRFYCTSCGIPLCKKQCFEDYHSKSNL